MREQQAGSAEEDAAGGPLYTFQRLTTAPSDTLLHERVPPSRRTGLIKTAFRPSDDAAVFPFHTADNAAAAAALRALARLLTAPPVAARLDARGGARLAADAAALAAEVEAALEARATFTHALTGARIYSYESDGFGNHLFMDDANLPSLLGLPLLRGFCDAHNAALCTASREHALSADTNAYFVAGAVAAGIGSPHTGAGRTVWPLAVVTRAETSSNATEIQEALRMLVASSACTGLLHESFDADDATRFSRGSRGQTPPLPASWRGWRASGRSSCCASPEAHAPWQRLSCWMTSAAVMWVAATALRVRLATGSPDGLPAGFVQGDDAV